MDDSIKEEFYSNFAGCWKETQNPNSLIDIVHLDRNILCWEEILNNPKINQKTFNQEMAQRMRAIEGCARSWEEFIFQNQHILGGSINKKSADKYKALLYFFENFGTGRETFQEKIYSFRVFTKIARAWINAPVTQIPGTFLRAKPVIFRHEEAPLGIELIDQEGKQIAHIGGQLHKKGRSFEAAFTNIQGTDKMEYSSLNTALKENWRVFFTKHFAELLNKKGLSVMLIEPKRYNNTPKQHKRTVRQYRQTAKKVGFLPLGPRTWKFARQR